MICVMHRHVFTHLLVISKFVCFRILKKRCFTENKIRSISTSIIFYALSIWEAAIIYIFPTMSDLYQFEQPLVLVSHKNLNIFEKGNYNCSQLPWILSKLAITLFDAECVQKKGFSIWLSGVFAPFLCEICLSWCLVNLCVSPFLESSKNYGRNHKNVSTTARSVNKLWRTRDI